MTSWNWSAERSTAYSGGWERIRSSAWHRDNGLCQHIRYDTGLPCFAEGKAVDHIKPLSQGGSLSLSNTQVLCGYHHAQKTASEAATGKTARRRAKEAAMRKKHPGSLA
ncbi:HNH endonuclease [Streptomyces sp. NPDC059708]|uniref:HNH endonuclease n=1 Tax=Streptomyces sp. NPDC059708 TaxID=3346916 RepID=UPI0036C7796C